jgi:hypothetical protein
MLSGSNTKAYATNEVTRHNLAGDSPTNAEAPVMPIIHREVLDLTLLDMQSYISSLGHSSVVDEDDVDADDSISAARGSAAWVSADSCARANTRI